MPVSTISSHALPPQSAPFRAHTHLRRSLPNMSAAALAAQQALSNEPPKIYPAHLLFTTNYRLPIDVDRCQLEVFIIKMNNEPVEDFIFVKTPTFWFYSSAIYRKRNLRPFSKWHGRTFTASQFGSVMKSRNASNCSKNEPGWIFQRGDDWYDTSWISQLPTAWGIQFISNLCCLFLFLFCSKGIRGRVDWQFSAPFSGKIGLYKFILTKSLRLTLGLIRGLSLAWLPNSRESTILSMRFSRSVSSLEEKKRVFRNQWYWSPSRIDYCNAISPGVYEKAVKWNDWKLDRIEFQIRIWPWKFVCFFFLLICLG